MALLARAPGGPDSGGELAIASAPTLDSGIGQIGNRGGVASLEAKEGMSDNSLSDSALNLERLIPSSPEVLFTLWIEPAHLLKWWAPDGYQCSVDSLDARPGGRWRTILSSSDGRQVAISGVYRIVEPPRRLAFSWAWEDDNGARGHETEVSVDFIPVPGGTRLVLVQQRFQSKQARDNHVVGWSSSFDRLMKLGG